MKRFITMLAALALVFTLAVPAFCEMEDELTAVTERVVEVLDVAEDYTDFTSSFQDGLRPSWYLSWSKDGEDLTVTCTPDGLITSVERWKNDSSANRFYGYDAAFPALSEKSARQQAGAWLARLMGENERPRIDDASASITSNGFWRISGRILMNGLESPVTFSMTIGEEGLVRYDRSDSYRGYVGGLPAAQAGVAKQAAAPLLKDAVELELYYVTDGDEARLRYIPVGAYTVVDAQSGEAVDMDALYASFGGAHGGPETPAAAEMSLEGAADNGAGRPLTAVETASIGKYGDVLSQVAIDTALRGLGDLGLADFGLTRCSYGMDAEGEITASLRYTCEMTADNLFGYSLDNFWQVLDWGDTPTVTKYITVDAKTGTLISVSTDYPLWEKAETGAPDAAAAEAFLKKAAPERFAESALCTLKGYDQGGELTYARMHDGYFFPENHLSVTLNTATNTVDSYYCIWDEDAVFAPSKGLVSEQAALDAYDAALSVTLGYTAWPEAIDYDDPILYAWADWGYTYVESLRLAWYYAGLDAISGVDALTGQPVRQDPDGGFVYTDIADSPYRAQIQALADCGIGLPGTAFEPERKLTMEDAARLLLSSAGVDPSDWDKQTLRDEAVWQGFITADAWEPARNVTEAEFIRMLLSASRYGDAAALEGVGYALVARSLGMIREGDLPAGDCTRGGAAALLYSFMDR